MRNGFIFALALCTCAAFAQERDFSKVEVKATKIAGTVYMITGAGGNIGVSAGDDGIVIIDDQFAPLAPKIIQALNTITDKPIKFIINTHYHGDHVGGNEIFGRTGTIIAHDNVRKRLASGTSARGRSTPPLPEAGLADRHVQRHGHAARQRRGRPRGALPGPVIPTVTPSSISLNRMSCTWETTSSTASSRSSTSRTAAASKG